MAYTFALSTLRINEVSLQDDGIFQRDSARQTHTFIHQRLELKLRHIHKSLRTNSYQ